MYEVAYTRVKTGYVCAARKCFAARFVNKHMLQHYQETNHCAGLSYRSDLSVVWCFACDAYLDAQVILQLRPVHETAYILKFGEAPPLQSVEHPEVEDRQNEGT